MVKMSTTQQTVQALMPLSLWPSRFGLTRSRASLVMSLTSMVSCSTARSSFDSFSQVGEQIGDWNGPSCAPCQRLIEVELWHVVWSYFCFLHHRSRSPSATLSSKTCRHLVMNARASGGGGRPTPQITGVSHALAEVGGSQPILVRLITQA